MSEHRSLNSNSVKKKRILIGCAIAGTAVLMAGTGVGIGYAVFHNEPEPAKPDYLVSTSKAALQDSDDNDTIQLSATKNESSTNDVAFSVEENVWVKEENNQIKWKSDRPALTETKFVEVISKVSGKIIDTRQIALAHEDSPAVKSIGINLANNTLQVGTSGFATLVVTEYNFKDEIPNFNANSTGLTGSFSRVSDGVYSATINIGTTTAAGSNVIKITTTSAGEQDFTITVQPAASYYWEIETSFFDNDSVSGANLYIHRGDLNWYDGHTTMSLDLEVEPTYDDSSNPITLTLPASFQPREKRKIMAFFLLSSGLWQSHNVDVNTNGTISFPSHKLIPGWHTVVFNDTWASSTTPPGNQP